MHKLDDWRTAGMFIVASLSISYAYYLKDVGGADGILADFSPDLIYGGATLIFVASAAIARFLIGEVFKIQGVRKFVLGRAYVEGYWLLRTEYSVKHSKASDSVRALGEVGIAYMSYKMECREFKIETTRYRENRRYITQSEVGYVRTTGSTIRYLNFFNLTFPDPNGVNGFSSGSFAFGDGFHGCPQHFESQISLQNGEYLGRQFAERIPKKKVEELRRKAEKESTDWMRDYIECVTVGDRKITSKSQDATTFDEIKDSPNSSNKQRKIARSKNETG